MTQHQSSGRRSSPDPSGARQLCHQNAARSHDGRHRSPLAVAAAVLAASAVLVAVAGCQATSGHGSQLAGVRASSSVRSPGPSDDPNVDIMTPAAAQVTAQGAIAEMNGAAGSVNQCNGTLPSLSISSFNITGATEQSTGTFDITVEVTLTDGSRDTIEFLVTNDATGAPCVEADTVRITPLAAALPATNTPTPGIAAPADIPAIPSRNDPVPLHAPLPGPPADAQVVPYTDAPTTPTQPSQIVESRPHGLDRDEQSAVNDVVGFMTLINEQDFDSAWLRSTERLSGPTASAGFETGYRTTVFYQAAFGTPGRVAADLIVIPARFASRQDPAAQGHPDGVTDCSYWPQYLWVVARVNGRWLVDVAGTFQSRPQLDRMRRIGHNGLVLNPTTQRESC